MRPHRERTPAVLCQALGPRTCMDAPQGGATDRRLLRIARRGRTLVSSISIQPVSLGSQLCLHITPLGYSFGDEPTLSKKTHPPRPGWRTKAPCRNKNNNNTTTKHRATLAWGPKTGRTRSMTGAATPHKAKDTTYRAKKIIR